MAPPPTDHRHPSYASTSGDSARSTDTLKGSAPNRPRTPEALRPSAQRQWSFEDGQVSPGSHPALSASSKTDIAPWDLSPNVAHAQAVNYLNQHMNHRNGATGSDRTPTQSGRVSPIRRGFEDDRRPSVASSADSAGSGASRSRASNRKLQGWFGEDNLSRDGRQIYPSQHIHKSSTTAADGSLDIGRPNYKRTPSFNTLRGRPFSSRNTSPGPSLRPELHTKPSSDVTPWDFQTFDDIPRLGLSPASAKADDREPLSRQKSHEKSNSNVHHHRFPLHWHRPHKSSEDTGQGDLPPLAQSTTTKTEAFPSLPREASSNSSSGGAFDIPSRQMSKSPSRDQLDGQSPKQHPDSAPQKRSFFDRIRNRHRNTSHAAKSDNSSSGPLSGRGRNATDASKSSTSLAQVTTNDGKSRGRPGTASESVPPPSRREHHRLPFKRSRATNDSNAALKDPNNARSDVPQQDALWSLDTDLSNLEGIVQQDITATPTAVQTGSKKQLGTPAPNETDQQNPAAHAAWDAPDSWAVKRMGDENEEKLHEIDETGAEGSIEPSAPHVIRIFKPDGSSNTMTVDINITAAELVNVMGQKNQAQDNINRFHIIMQKHDTSRQLEPGERPVLLQRRLLQQAGYEEKDHLETICQEDHSYLCRFTYMPAKMIGYSTLDKDLSLNTKQKFSNVDLQSRSLNNIPIALYQKCGEIVFLNLSRNLNLDVPKDFISGCTSLREIRYTSNEASRLPPSFCMANRLTVLDVSNNRLEQLDHADLEKLPNLASLRLANNRLKTMPSSFSTFRSLRSLNVSSNFLTELPSSICSLKTLVDLDVSFNAIENLTQIAGLENLERLWATNNKLAGEPDGTIEMLKNLREIDIRFNKINNLDRLADLPQLEHLMAGHNSIAKFEGTFPKIRTLYLDHNPITRFDLFGPVPSLNTLSLASAKLVELPDELYGKMSGLSKLILTKNHIATLTPSLWKLSKLDHLSIAKNSLETLPAEVGRLSELRFLDVRENNIRQLPSEIWLCRRLETFNVSSNVLDAFPKPPTSASLANLEATPSNASINSSAPIAEEPDQLGDFGPLNRRPSQASGYLSSSNGSPGTQRKSSLASTYGPSSRKPSVLSRTPTDMSTGGPGTLSRKDSIMANRVLATFIGSLRHLFLADNRLGDEVFDQLINLQELRVVNLSYNELYEIPARTLRRWPLLTDLYLSGNDLTSLPSEDFEDCGALRILHINCNKFQVLPAELGKVQKLATLDASCNNLKYNVTNWPYDWNWNWNRNLKYLSLSGNRRLEIKPSGAYTSGRDSQNLTDFGNLPNLRVLGLMDVTLMTSAVPDETDDRRVRTSGSNAGSMPYGISDSLGNYEHLSTIEMVVPRLLGHEDETLIALFDGVYSSNGGSRIVKYLQENFRRQCKEELRNLAPGEDAGQALRRTYLALNKELALWETRAAINDGRKTRDGSAASNLSKDDLHSGCVATVLYLNGMDLHVSNVGNAEALLIQSEGSYRTITKKHDPAEAEERLRIRDAGGFVSRQGKLNDMIDVSRAFGFTQLIPAISAAPHISHIHIQDSDEMILLASRELWDYLTPDFAVDLARSERSDLMRASRKLRDLAIAFGASGKITVMIIGVSDLRRRERARYRTHSMSMGPSGAADDGYTGTRRGNRRGRPDVVDSKLARLDREVEAPTGDISLVFTDIKNSTLLWETYPTAMRSAIKMHNEVMRRHLRLIGGYEVKTEGDAFMVAFPTVTSALLWTFTIQSQLLEVQWPEEILQSVSGQVVHDSDGNVLFKGLSVRMGIHWGNPVCETDPVTRRMDYFGPVVNRAARISSVADGGQITVSFDFIAEIQRLLETHIESDRSNSMGSDDTAMSEDNVSQAIRRELRSLSGHGFEVKDLGEKRLKGLENPEYIYLIYPHALAGRLLIQQQRAEAEKAALVAESSKAPNSQLTMELQNVWDLWNISLRLEMLCSMLEHQGGIELKAPETALLERTKERGGEITDRFLINFVEHQVSRIETCTTTLALRNMVRPFSAGMAQSACPMTDIFAELTSSLKELKTLQESIDIDMAPS